MLAVLYDGIAARAMCVYVCSQFCCPFAFVLLSSPHVTPSRYPPPSRYKTRRISRSAPPTRHMASFRRRDCDQAPPVERSSSSGQMRRIAHRPAAGHCCSTRNGRREVALGRVAFLPHRRRRRSRRHDHRPLRHSDVPLSTVSDRYKTPKTARACHNPDDDDDAAPSNT